MYHMKYLNYGFASVESIVLCTFLYSYTTYVNMLFNMISQFL